MNTDKETVGRVANTLALHWGYVDEPHPATLMRELLRERDEERARTAEARALAKLWRDVYEWDAIKDPLPEYYFPWEKKP